LPGKFPRVEENEFRVLAGFDAKTLARNILPRRIGPKGGPGLFGAIKFGGLFQAQREPEGSDYQSKKRKKKKKKKE